ncbi:MAG TPA: hypothetical protein VGK67_04150 [Myxococcales bacterium]
MSALPQRFSRSGIVNEWFEDEAAQASAQSAAQLRRLAQAVAGIALSLALLVGFGAMAYFAVDRATAANAGALVAAHSESR